MEGFLCGSCIDSIHDGEAEVTNHGFQNKHQGQRVEEKSLDSDSALNKLGQELAKCGGLRPT